MIYLFIFMPEVFTVESTESVNFFYITHRVTCTIKLNIKETFLENKSLWQMFIWWMDCMQSENKRPTNWQIYHLVREGWLNSIKVQVFFRKKHMYSHDNNYYYFCKSDILVINLIVGSRNMIKLSKNISLKKIR